MKTFAVTTKTREYRIVDVYREYRIEAETEEEAEEIALGYKEFPAWEWENVNGTDSRDDEEVTDTEDITPMTYCYACESEYPTDEYGDHKCNDTHENEE